MIRRNATILSITLISAFQASAQSREADIFSQLVVTCASMPSDSNAIPPDLTGALSFVESTVSDTMEYEPSKKHTPAPRATGMGVLNAISGAYSGLGYYSSGAWNTEPQYYPSAIRPPVSGIPYEIKATQHISSSFGYRDRFNRMHFGIDIAMSPGDTIRATMPGAVITAGYDKGYGRFIIIFHDNGLETRYAHLSRNLAVSGQRIEAGDAIALSGNTGNSTGPHLHLETRFRGIPVDPKSVFDFKKIEDSMK